MTHSFDDWVNSLRFQEDVPPGDLPAGTTTFLREVYDRDGPVSRDDVANAWDEKQLGLAHAAIELLVSDIQNTTDLKNPKFKVRLEDGTLIVSYKGSYNAPALFSIQAPEAICEVVENLRDHIMDELWTAWPVCPTHHVGLYAEPIDGRAVWYCRLARHSVDAVGKLGRQTTGAP